MSNRTCARLAGVVGTALAVGLSAGGALARGPGKSVVELGSAGGGAAGAFGEFDAVEVDRAREGMDERSGVWVRAAGSWVEIAAAGNGSGSGADRAALWVSGESAMEDLAPAGGQGRAGLLGGLFASRLDISRPLTPEYAIGGLGGRNGAGLMGGAEVAWAEVSLAVAAVSDLFGISGASEAVFAVAGGSRWTGGWSGAVASQADARRVAWGGSFALLVYAARQVGAAGAVGGNDAGPWVDGASGEGVAARASFTGPPQKLVDFIFESGGTGSSPIAVGLRGPEKPRRADGDDDSTGTIPGPGAAVVLGLGGLMGMGRRRRAR